MNEISFGARLNASKGGAKVAYDIGGNMNMAGGNMVQQPQDIPTTGVQIDFGTVSGTPAKVLIVNLDATNYITLYRDNAYTQDTDKILPQDVVLRSPTSGNLWAKANTATCKIQIVAVEA